MRKVNVESHSSTARDRRGRFCGCRSTSLANSSRAAMPNHSDSQFERSKQDEGVEARRAKLAYAAAVERFASLQVLNFGCLSRLKLLSFRTRHKPVRLAEQDFERQLKSRRHSSVVATLSSQRTCTNARSPARRLWCCSPPSPATSGASGRSPPAPGCTSARPRCPTSPRSCGTGHSSTATLAGGGSEHHNESIHFVVNVCLPSFHDGCLQCPPWAYDVGAEKSFVDSSY